MKILNIRYWLLFSILIFSVLAVSPVRAADQTTSCSLAELRELRKEPAFEPSVLMPRCVYFEGFTDYEEACGCRNINVFMQLLVNAANWMFGIVGGAALIVFIYGGFKMLTSAGNDEAVKKGKDALVAAVIGLIIVFTAQLGMRFLLETVVPESALKQVGSGEGELEININK
jgi:hypothetical protein